MRAATAMILMVAGAWSVGRAGGEDDKPRTVDFAGRTWNVKVGRALGPGPNDWADSAEAVRVDAEGHLHLAILPTAGGWTCAEVVAPASLGHGEYRWTIAGRLPTLDPRSVVGLFTYEDNDHEIDFELSRWGKPGDGNSQFVLQPYAPDSMRRFDAGQADVVTASFDWRADAVHFRCWAGTDTTRPPLHEWTYAGPKVPKPGKERAIINFWLLDGRPSPGAKRQDVTIRSFDFRPAPPKQP